MWPEAEVTQEAWPRARLQGCRGDRWALAGGHFRAHSSAGSGSVLVPLSPSLTPRYALLACPSSQTRGPALLSFHK